MVEFEEIIAYYLYTHPKKIVHFNEMYFCYDSDTNIFNYRFINEDDNCWRPINELNRALVNYLVLNE